MQLSLNQEELWTLQQLVRRAQGNPDYGAAWDKDDMRLIQSGILALEGQSPESEYRLECSEGLLWQIEAQVPQSLDLGRTNRGRVILSKVFKLLDEEAEDVLTPLPAIYRRHFPNSLDYPLDDPNNHTDEDYPADSYVAGAPTR